MMVPSKTDEFSCVASNRLGPVDLLELSVDARNRECACEMGNYLCPHCVGLADVGRSRAIRDLDGIPVRVLRSARCPDRSDALALATLTPLGGQFTSSSGDERTWTMEATIPASHSATELTAAFHDTATTLLGWKALRTNDQQGCFAFDDFDGTTWQTCVEVGAPANGATPVTLRANRQGAAVASK
jgi:hypothetical protein